MSVAGLAPPLTEQAADIERVWNGFMIAALGVGLLVAVLLTIVLVRFRRRRGDVDTTLPRQVHEHVPLELSYTIVPLLIVVVLFAVTFVSVNAVDEADADVELVVEVIGFQWQWQFDYPEAGVSVHRHRHDDARAGASGRHGGALRPPLGRRHPLVLDPGIPLQAGRVPGPGDVVLRRRRVAHRVVPEHRCVRRVLRARPPHACASRCAS